MSKTNIIPISPGTRSLARPIAPSAVGLTDRRLKSSLRDAGLDISIRPAALGGSPSLVLRPAPHFDVDRALDLIAAAMQPAQQRDVLAWLAGLRSITAHKQVADADMALATRLYVERLSIYPADVVQQVLLSERWKFWPALAELEERCDELVAPRERLARYVQQGYFTVPAPEVPPIKRVTDEARERILRECGFGGLIRRDDAQIPAEQSARPVGNLGAAMAGLLRGSQAALGGDVRLPAGSWGAEQAETPASGQHSGAVAQQGAR